MSGEIATSKAAQPKIPDVLWQQSGRPIQGLLLQIWIVLMMVAVAWVVVDLTTNPVMWAIAVLGPLGFLLVPALTERLVLERYGKQVAAVEAGDKAKAHALLETLRNNTSVKILAPHGWLRVQEGWIHLVVGDGRAAALAYAEAERVSTHPGDKRELISAQAHALTMAGDRKEARALLSKLAKLEALSDLDHLNYGIVLLSESGHNKDALVHFEAAREGLGGHPRVLAGMVLALQRCDRADDAAKLLDAAEAAVADAGDTVAEDLLKRGRKALRPMLKAQQKRERKAEKQGGKAEKQGGKNKPKGKKGRQQARRDARRKAKADARKGDEPKTEAVDEAEEQADEAVEGTETELEDSREQEEVADSDEQDGDEQDGDEQDGDEQEAAEQEAAEQEAAEQEAARAKEVAEQEAARAKEAAEREAARAKEVAEQEAARAKEVAAEQEAARAKEAAEQEAAREREAARAKEAAEREQEAAREKEAAERAAREKQAAEEAKKADDIDLTTLARDALGRPAPEVAKIEKPTHGIRPIEPIEPASSSSTMFRSALMSEDEEPASKPAGGSLFSMPDFGSVPKFAPPPKAKPGSILPPRKPEPELPKIFSKPVPSKPAPAPVAPPVAPPIAPPLAGKPLAPIAPPPTPGAPAAPLAPPSPSAAPVPAPDLGLDDGWGDLGDLTPPTPAPGKDD